MCAPRAMSYGPACCLDIEIGQTLGWKPREEKREGGRGVGRGRQGGGGAGMRGAAGEGFECRFGLIVL